MLFSEIIKMAWSSLGANKLRSLLTMLGITIGVFSVISVMTAIGALQYSIENGLSFLGSNIFQFAKYPANVSASGDVQEKFRNRHNITYKQALHYYSLLDGEAREICLKSFGYEVKGQAVYNGVKTTPSLLIVGANRSFLTANAYTLGYGRNLNDEDVDLSRRVIVVGKMIEKRLFPHETPIGKVVRVSGTRTRLLACSRRKGRRSDKARTTCASCRSRGSSRITGKRNAPSISRRKRSHRILTIARSTAESERCVLRAACVRISRTISRFTATTRSRAHSLTLPDTCEWARS